MDEDTQALLALLGDDSRALLLDVARALSRIEARQARDVPPADVRANMAETAGHIEQMAAFVVEEGDSASILQTQMAEIVAWMHARMSGDELEHQFEEQSFVSKQLISIMHGTRDDLVLMRADLRRLSALLEQTLRARVEDDERWDGGERRQSIPDRRRG